VSDLVDSAVTQEDFDDIESEFDFGVLNLAEVIQRGAGEPALALEIDRGCGPGPLLVGAGFDFDKGEAIVIEDDQVDFAMRRSEVGGEEAQALALEVSARLALTELTAAEVFWGARSAKNGFESVPEWHGQTARVGWV
jgi:hypothetical protein